MNREQARKKVGFKCRDFGIRYPDFYVYENGVVVNSPKDDVFVLLDPKFNIMGVHRAKSKSKKVTAEDFSNLYAYSYETIDEEQGFKFPHPFENYSLKQMTELADRINLHPTNHGHSFDVIVNQQKLTDSEYSNYIPMLGFIRFIGDEIYEYHLTNYKMKMLGFDFIDVYSYINNVVSNINKCIDSFVERGDRPLPVDVASYLGKKIEEIDDDALYCTIDLFLKAKGYEIKNVDYVTKVEDEDVDLTKTADELLTLLNISDEVVNERMSDRELFFVTNEVDIKDALKEAKEKGKAKELKPKKNEK